MKASLRLLVLLLPVVGLGGAWGWTHVRAQQGAEWDVPVSVSGPHASLRGRYLAFRYDWGLGDDVDLGSAQALCLEGAPPVLETVRATGADDHACRHLVRAMEGGSRFSGLRGGILYVPQEQVPAIRRQLADPALTAVARIRVNDSGVVTPLRIAFQRRPTQPR